MQQLCCIKKRRLKSCHGDYKYAIFRMLFLFPWLFLCLKKGRITITVNLVSFRKKLSGTAIHSPSISPGVFKAIEAGFDGESNCVDWNSFSLNNAMAALHEAFGYCDEEYIDSESLINPNKDNLIHQYLHNRNAIRSLKKSTPLKQNEDIQFF